jgi:hypothetical protein
MHPNAHAWMQDKPILGIGMGEAQFSPIWQGGCNRVALVLVKNVNSNKKVFRLVDQ